LITASTVTVGTTFSRLVVDMLAERREAASAEPPCRVRRALRAGI
jgi:hypothetical protein